MRQSRLGGAAQTAGKVSDDVVWLRADQESEAFLAPAVTSIEGGKIGGDIIVDAVEDWQPKLLRHVAPENVGRANAEAIWIHRRNLGPYLLQQCECALTRRLGWCWAPERLRKKPHDQTDYRE